MSLHLHRSALLVLPALVGLAACSASTTNYQAAAEKVITGDIQTQAGLGDLKGSCEKPADTKAESTFPCTATTPDGDTIEMIATIKEGNKVSVNTTNLITAEGLGQIEQLAVKALEDEVGVTLGTENFDCGSSSLVIDVTKDTIKCIATDPGTGKQYDAEITIPSLDRVGDLSVKVADTPRS